MTLIEFFSRQLNSEVTATRKMLQRVPAGQLTWKPHSKSMDMKSLATHIAELPTWIPMALDTTELDFATMEYTPPAVNNADDLVALFEKSVSEAQVRLARAYDTDLEPDWTLRNADKIYIVCSKGDMIRTALSQLIHHRAQLGVYLRLLDIPIPGSYGPSADEQEFA